MTVLRVAVVGCGVGRAHIAAYQQLPEQYSVVAVCDLNEDLARDVGASLNVPRVTADITELCRMDDIDVVDVCTPPLHHLANVEQVLAAGKHAICEKPLVASLAALDRLTEAEASSPGRLMPIFQYRFGAGVQKLKHLIDAGLAGTPHLATVEVAWRRRSDYYAPAWRGTLQGELGGVVLNHAIHALDMLTFITAPVEKVFARTTTRVNDIEIEDCAVAALELSDGSLASFSTTLGSSAEISRHRFAFSGLTAESNHSAYGNSGDPWIFTGDTPEQQERIDAALADFHELPAGWVGQFLRFHDALASGAEPPVTVAQARATLELITALYFSADHGVDVELPLPVTHPYYEGWLPMKTMAS